MDDDFEGYLVGLRRGRRSLAARGVTQLFGKVFLFQSA